VLDEETGNIQNSIQFINGFEFTVQDNDLFFLYRDGLLKRMSLNKRTFWASDFELGIPGESFFHTDENLIVPFAKGVVINVNMNTGTEIWRSDSLQRLTGFWQAGRGFLMQDIKYQMQYYR
jgi:outer membrane protein assembly factor BamB